MCYGSSMDKKAHANIYTCACAYVRLYMHMHIHTHSSKVHSCSYLDRSQSWFILHEIEKSFLPVFTFSLPLFTSFIWIYSFGENPFFFLKPIQSCNQQSLTSQLYFLFRDKLTGKGLRLLAFPPLFAKKNNNPLTQISAHQQRVYTQVNQTDIGNVTSRDHSAYPQKPAQQLIRYHTHLNAIRKDVTSFFHQKIFIFYCVD